MGYHLTNIPKGVLGDVTKIEEEFLEFKDAIAQHNKVMALVELSDLIGAIEAYVKKEYKDSISLENLVTMTKATQRAFQSGQRK